MPRRRDIRKIMIIGSGPIVIGQACEFDYSGTQACKALKEEGYEVILVNSNPATIMTDPSTADRTYVEPLTVEVLSDIIAKERPDALLPTLGGQTGLNLALNLDEAGVLKAFNVEMIGADAAVIHKAEDRQAFKDAMTKIGISLPKSFIVYTLEDAKEKALALGFPCVVRPAFTLGGTGGGICTSMEELEDIAAYGLSSSMISEILIEESILGWKEYELEVMRDRHDNVVIVCSIENLDPMGIHTGDSTTVAPAQTLTDKEYQDMRDAGIAIIREIGVETGGSNIQFAINPADGRLVVIEMNPRVSRSSALASKATGFPIAKLAAKLAVGYTLDELENDITKKTPACFEPTLDYVVVKIPRFNFDKFPRSQTLLGTSMKAVGEVMAIGRTFKEALQKGLRSLEIKRFGFGFDGRDYSHLQKEDIVARLDFRSPDRIFVVHRAFELGLGIDEVAKHTAIDPWFLYQMKQLLDFAGTLDRDPETIRQAKEWGFSDLQLSRLLDFDSEDDFRAFRKSLNILPTYSLVDTCAAEFEAETPYYYSTYESENEARISKRDKIMILGGGPNRIGQGIEFDYCCVHASMASRERGYESIMVNSNPETVSTDFDISDKLYFEPLTFEDVLNIYEMERPKGVIIQFGGQTPLNLSKRLEAAGVQILGTSSDSIDLAEDRERFQQLLQTLDLRQPANGIATSFKEAVAIAARIHYPVVVRPSYVLGGASMDIVYDEAGLKTYMEKAEDVSPDHPILIDKYLEQATEVDVDALADGETCLVSGIMEHIEEAGVHSGDSACSLPPYTLDATAIAGIKAATVKLAKALKVIGLMNIQFAIKDGELYVLEVNPRASRTVPFVSKATGIPWAKMATRVILGESIADLGISETVPPFFSVKEVVLPFKRFSGGDILLSPEMKSTGEVMGTADNFAMAFMKSQLAAGQVLPQQGTVFISVHDRDKTRAAEIAGGLLALGFTLIATEGTGRALADANIAHTVIQKISEGPHNVTTRIEAGDVNLVFNTATRRDHLADEVKIRQLVLTHNIPYVTTLSAMQATVDAIAGMARGDAMTVAPLQDLYTLNGTTQVNAT